MYKNGTRLHFGTSLVAQMVKNLPAIQERFDPQVRKISWRRKWPPTSVFLPREFHGQRSLETYSPWGCKSQTQLKPLCTACLVYLFLNDLFLLIFYLTNFFFSVSQSYCFFLVFLRYIQRYLFIKSLYIKKDLSFFFYQMVTGFCILFYFGSQFCFSELSTYISLFFLQFNVLYSLSMIIALQCGRITFFLHLLHKLKGILPLSEPLKILNLEPILQRERTQKEKNKCINSYIQNLEKWY